MLGFLDKSDAEPEELSLYLIGNMNEHIQHRGFQFHPDDIENTISRANRFDTTNLLTRRFPRRQIGAYRF